METCSSAFTERESLLFPYFTSLSELYFHRNSATFLFLQVSIILAVKFMKTIPVTCAIIIHKGKVLLAQRSESMDLPGKWEFPGGKLEQGEDPESGLIREIREELGIEIRVTSALTPVDFSYPTKTIRLIPFVAQWLGGEITLLEHAQYGWYDQNQLFSLDLAPADLPILHELTEKWVNLV